ncbi:universal stress protein [Streptomyces sp. SID4919]|uniref:universal stress protein n=1 Tax=unclassified Streptomyces TaxID=2593676 RepID=UPI0008238B17|nr:MULTISPECIES: universal stress protein [unclassified Streptomyces]MYY07806.1 universal stress protein [Streptomyces sp. SID4919]SCK05870.1 Nucleotide-binding universal stress protein, UspA family [Streptomyces sp. AmelKG-E11A]
MARAIAVGVDGSPESLAAVDWAAHEAALRRLPLRIVHAPWWEPRDVPVNGGGDALSRAAEAVVAKAEARAAEGRPELEIGSEVVAEDPVDALLGAARTAEMLVLGSKGQGPVLGFLLGSYGQQVIAEARRPVVSVRSPGDRPPPRAGEVVVGQQGSAEDSRPALAFAFAAAAARGATLRAVRAWSLPPLHAYSPEFLRLTDEAGGLEPLERTSLREALEPWREKFPDVRVVEHVEIGSAGQVLLAASTRAQLLVVGRRARYTPIGGRIGSVAHAALHHAPCPVAVTSHH